MEENKKGEISLPDWAYLEQKRRDKEFGHDLDLRHSDNIPGVVKNKYTIEPPKINPNIKSYAFIKWLITVLIALSGALLAYYRWFTET